MRAPLPVWPPAPNTTSAPLSSAWRAVVAPNSGSVKATSRPPGWYVEMTLTSGLVYSAPFSKPSLKATTGGTWSVPRTAAIVLVSVSSPARAPARKPAWSSLKTSPVQLQSGLGLELVDADERDVGVVGGRRGGRLAEGEADGDDHVGAAVDELADVVGVVGGRGRLDEVGAAADLLGRRLGAFPRRLVERLVVHLADVGDETDRRRSRAAHVRGSRSPRRCHRWWWRCRRSSVVAAPPSVVPRHHPRWLPRRPRSSPHRRPRWLLRRPPSSRRRPHRRHFRHRPPAASPATARIATRAATRRRRPAQQPPRAAVPRQPRAARQRPRVGAATTEGGAATTEEGGSAATPVARRPPDCPARGQLESPSSARHRRGQGGRQVVQPVGMGGRPGGRRRGRGTADFIETTAANDYATNIGQFVDRAPT